MEERQPGEQQLLLQSLGYQGIVTEWKGTEPYAAFLSHSLVATGELKLVAALVTIDAGAPIDEPYWLNVFETLKAGNTRPWLLVGGLKNQQRIGESVRALSQLSASVSDIPIVLYPHWRMGIETT